MIDNQKSRFAFYDRIRGLGPDDDDDSKSSLIRRAFILGRRLSPSSPKFWLGLNQIMKSYSIKSAYNKIK